MAKDMNQEKVRREGEKCEEPSFSKYMNCLYSYLPMRPINSSGRHRKMSSALLRKRVPLLPPPPPPPPNLYLWKNVYSRKFPRNLEGAFLKKIFSCTSQCFS